jgi:hypothetical protein
MLADRDEYPAIQESLSTTEGIAIPDRPYLALIDQQTTGNRCDVAPLFATF